MGQQQLLLVILITIIVGIASIVAVTTFDSANRDAILNDLKALASEAQEYFIRPEPLDGGGRTFNGFSISGKLMPVDGINASGDLAQTQNGTIDIREPVGKEFTIVAHTSNCEGYLPGFVDDDGLLTDPGTCGEIDQIRASVSAGDIIFES